MLPITTANTKLHRTGGCNDLYISGHCALGKLILTSGRIERHLMRRRFYTCKHTRTHTCTRIHTQHTQTTHAFAFTHTHAHTHACIDIHTRAQNTHAHPLTRSRNPTRRLITDDAGESHPVQLVLIFAGSGARYWLKGATLLHQR